MGDQMHDIDEVFRQRFDGLKNYSADPSVGWAAVESGLSTTGAAMGSSVSSGILWSKAAVFIGSAIVMAGAIHGDRIEDTSTQYHINYSSSVPNEPMLELKRSIESAPFAMADTLNSGAKPTSHSSVSSIINSSPVSADVEETVHTAHSEIESLALSGASNEEPQRAIEYIDLMHGLRAKYNQQDIIDRAFEDPIISTWNSNHIWYLRGSARIGSGESNSFELEAEWKANPAFAFGYGYSLTDRSFITLEVGWLRRSGNGIERTRDINLDPIISSITGTNAAEGPEYLIHESLVATRMDYVHIPISFNQMFNDNWSVSVGGFMDYLISAKNDAYIVYDNTTYRAAVNGRTELNSKDGLNKIRYGALLGTERRITKNFSAFGNMMVPLNSAVDLQSEYRVIDETNRLIDVQLGIIYRI